MTAETLPFRLSDNPPPFWHVTATVLGALVALTIALLWARSGSDDR